MFLKALHGQEGPSGFHTESVHYYEGQRVHAEARFREDGNIACWLVTIERAGGSETVETAPGGRYYILNEQGKTIDTL
jgi:hypothetical protein